jgi:YggT family protein
MSYLQNAGAFLITSIFGFLICLFLLRAMLIAVGAGFYEPVCRFVYQLTNRVVTPLRGFIPRWRRVELASLLIAWLLALIGLTLIVVLFGVPISVPGLLLHALVDTLDWALLIELIAIFALCVLSFIPSVRHDSNFQLLTLFTNPIARPFRRLLPPIGGLDFSLWLASIALILVRMLVIAPLGDFAQHLS